MSESYKLIILPQAQQDMREISIYIAKELSAPQAALRLLDEFHETIRSLEHMPQRVKTIDEEPWGSAGVRKIRVKNYYIYFMIDEEEKAVKIIAVIYIRRDQHKQIEEKLF